MEKKQIKVDIDNGNVFFSDEIGVMHNPTKFILDFKNMTPRVDVRNKEFQPLVIKHNVILMDVFTAKSFLDALQDNIKKYEKTFGKIKTPKAYEKVKKERKSSKKTSKDMPSYFG
ncbi:DUF3467 domain-containing protein [Candidatus Woesearchaeota archaeon]|nr:DUF3467 domain-containing protein [Candidatus Woesearchaeota archaeon]